MAKPTVNCMNTNAGNLRNEELFFGEITSHVAEVNFLPLYGFGDDSVESIWPYFNPGDLLHGKATSKIIKRIYPAHVFCRRMELAVAQFI